MKFIYRLKVPKLFEESPGAIAGCEWWIDMGNFWLKNRLKRKSGIKLKSYCDLDSDEGYWSLKYSYNADVDLRPDIREMIKDIKRAIKLEVWPRYLKHEL